MARYVGTASVERPAEDVFDYLADFENVADWDPGVSNSTRCDDGPLGVGSRFEVNLGFLGRDLELVYRIVALERPRRVVLEADAGGFRSIDTIEVEAISPDRSRIRYDARIQLTGMRALLDGALQAAFLVVGWNALRELKRALAPADEAAASHAAPSRATRAD